MATSRPIHEQDLIKVVNIDTNCSHISYDTVKRPETVFDEMNQPIYTAYHEESEAFDHSQGFRVKWGGKYHMIAPGKSKIYPRYLAEHYAKHLADHMLLKEGKKINDPFHRKALLARIMVGVEQYHEELEYEDGEETLIQVEEINKKTPGEIDLGSVEEFHVTHEVSEEDIDDTTPNLGGVAADPSLEELKEAAKDAGITLTGKETKAQIAAKLKEVPVA